MITVGQQRAAAAAEAAGAGRSNIVTEAPEVDVSQFAPQQGATEAPSEQIQQGQAQAPQPQPSSASASDAVEAALSSSSAMPMVSSAPATDISASNPIGRYAEQRPAMHPGSGFVLDMGSGLLTAQAPQQQPRQEQQQEQPVQQPVAPRASYDAGTPQPYTRPEARFEQQAIDDERHLAQERGRREDQAKGRSEIRREGVVEKVDPPKTLTRANKRFKKIKELIRDKADKAIKNKHYSGMSFYETIFGMPSLMPHCVSIGTENLRESLREPNSGLLELVNGKLLEKDPNADPLDAEMCLADMNILMDAINGLDIEVTLEKSPVNINHSIQVRTLRVHWGRGIGLHPTQTKAFNADYDGDPAVINLDQTQLMRYARAMDRLISADGTPLIDPGFFPLEPFDDSQKKEMADLLKYRHMSWAPYLADRLIDAYMAACNDGEWTVLLHRIDEVADEYSETMGQSRSEAASAILKSLYDFSIDRRSLSISQQVAYVNEESSRFRGDLPTGLDPFIYDLINLTDEIIAGRNCPSLIEFTRFYNKYYGDIRDSEGRSKNVPFRLLADFAKAINRSDLITVGSKLFGVNAKGKAEEGAEVSITDLWQFTCAAGLTKRISGRCHMGSRELAVSTQVRSMVVEECPIRAWKDDNDFRAWISAFRDSYNFNKRMLNIASTGFRNGMLPVRDKSSLFDGIGDDYKGLAKAIIEVYGQKTVGHVFPTLIRESGGGKENSGNTIARYYGSMSLDKFAMNNRLVYNKEGDMAKFDAIDGRLKNGTFTQMDILMLIADRRTAQLGDYHEQWMKATEEHFEAVIRAYEYSGNIQDYNEYSDAIMEVIEAMSPEMFLHFGMESPDTFRRSKWGRRLLGAISLNEYRSVLFSMMIEYRLGRSAKMLAEMEEIESVAGSGQEHVTRLEELDAAFELEMETLGSSSMAWKTIASEALNGNRVFHTLMASNGVYKSGSETWPMAGKVRRWRDERTGEVKSSGVSFWDRPAEERDKYYSLINLLKSSEPIEVKLAVLSDVARVSQGYPNMTPGEMLGQIAHHPDRLHSGNRFDMDKGIRGDIDAIKESVDLLSSYKSKTPERVRKEANRVIKHAREDEAAFEAELKRLAIDPGYAVHVDTMLAADALASIFDKTYDDSEKIKQQAVVNGYFGCISYQRSGGFYTHLHMADNAVVNMVGYDQFTSRDLILVLSDPLIELTVYDEFGTPETISRASLCGGNSISDVIAYLDSHPHAACLCRRYIAGISSDTEGTARINAIRWPVTDRYGNRDSDFGDTGMYRIFSLLNDRPKFLATSVLITPSDNEVGRNMPDKINGNIRYLCQLIAYEVQQWDSGTDIVTDIENRLGLHKDTLMQLRKQGAFDETEMTDEDIAAVDGLYEEVIGEILDCIGIVQASGARLPRVTEFDLSNRSAFSHIDQSSVIAYYDARQQIGGARTAMMIGVEGAETKKNLVLKLYLEGRPDAYTMSEDGTTVIPMVPGLEQAADQSLVRDKRSLISSICKFLEVKRENGAETYNAKYKKYGDDGTNSMIKFIRQAKRAMLDRLGKNGSADIKDGTWSVEDASDLMARIKACGKKFEAVPILAQALIDADIRLGYIDVNKETGKPDSDSFVPSDYWNRADLMIAENSDGTLVVRTLEQLSVALRNRLSDDAVVSGDLQAVRAEMDQIALTLGTDMDTMLSLGEPDVGQRTIDGTGLHSTIGSIDRLHRLERGKRQRSSSNERNYSLLNSIFNDLKQKIGADVAKVLSRNAIEDISRQKFAELKKRDQRLAQSLKGIAYPVDHWVEMEGQWNLAEDPYGSRENIYDYLGTFRDRDVRIVPGPQSMILFDGSIDTVQDQSRFNYMLQNCIDAGMTAAFSGQCMDMLPDDLVANLVPMGADLWILPCFDMRLNGMMSSATVSAPAEIPVNPDNLIVNAEDTSFEFKEGDSTYHMTKELADRINIDFPVEVRLTDDRLFPNVVLNEEYRGHDLKLDYCTNEEIQKWIINADFDPDTLTMKGFDEAVVDIGVKPGTSGFEREKMRFQIRLQEYKAAFETADQDSILRSECSYDSIIGFVKLVIDGRDTVLAPVWPFHLEESGSVPTKYTVGRDDKGRAMLQIDETEQAFVLHCAYTGGLEGQYIKAFEGIGASDKMITSSERAKSRTLDNGIAIDGFYSAESIASRLFPSNKRIHTMISALMMTRMDPRYAYNFAMDGGAFPNHDVIDMPNGTTFNVRERLLRADLKMDEWRAIAAKNIRYHSDDRIDSIVRWWVNKCLAFGTVNPNLFLATKTDTGMLWPKITEFEAFMDTGYNFQKAFMAFMHAMNPTLMPDDIDYHGGTYLFTPVTDKVTADYGVLQMRVPHYNPEDGTEYHLYENVYISLGFFGDEFSGFKKVNINGYNRSIDNLNVANKVTGRDLVNLLTFARSEMNGVMPMSRIEAVSDNAIKPANKIEHDIDPADDGVTHLNVYSKGKTKLGRFLSNFEKAPIDLPEGRFDSIEGYWHYLGIKGDPREKERLKKLSGPEARKVGRELRRKYGTEKRDDFQQKIADAVKIKIETYGIDLIKNDDANLPFEHYYVSNGNIKDQRAKFGWFTDMLERTVDSIRERTRGE